uniref:RING-type domain-containing protein n=1 Tax=Oryza punctata TaxID=4537 RepID=A0A0E0M4B7_ORYPU
MRHLLQSSEHLAATTATAASGGRGVHTDTFLILAAVLCFLLCVVGLALVARCSRLCNPSSFAVEAEEAMPPAPCKGLKRKALQSLPTVSFEAAEEGGGGGGGEERPECAICLAEFARGDEVRVLPPPVAATEPPAPAVLRRRGGTGVVTATTHRRQRAPRLPDVGTVGAAPAGELAHLHRSRPSRPFRRAAVRIQIRVYIHTYVAT